MDNTSKKNIYLKQPHQLTNHVPGRSKRKRVGEDESGMEQEHTRQKLWYLMEHTVSTDSISLDATVNPCDQPPSQVSTHPLPASSSSHGEAYTEKAPVHPSASYVDLTHSAHALTISLQLPASAPAANRLGISKGFENRTSATQNLRHNTLSEFLIILLNSSSHSYSCWT
jgi:hypothetical protein